MPLDPRSSEPGTGVPPAGADLEKRSGFTRDLLDHILHHVPQSVFWKNRDGVYQGCNLAFARAVGLEHPDQIVGKTDFDLPWPREEAEGYRAADREVMDTGRPKRHIGEPLQQADGTRLWIDTTKVPLRDERGAIVGVLGIYDDVTERRNAEDDLRLRTAIIESSPDFIGVADAEGRGIALNAAGLAQAGYTEAQFRDGMSIWDFQPDLPAEALATALRDGVWCGETTIRRQDGSEFPVSQIITAVEDAAGRHTALATIARDITESQRTRQALRESERMLQLVLDTIPARVFWKTKDLTYLGCNRLFAEDAGKAAAGDVVGKTDFEMAWRDQAHLYRADDQAVIESGEAKIGYEEPQTTPDGRRIWLRTSKIPLRDDRGETIGVLGTYEDITARNEADAALRERLAFEGLIAAISTRFINLRPDEIDAGVTEALQEIGQFTGVDRSYVFLLRDDSHLMDNTHEWCAAGIEPQLARLQGLRVADFPSVQQKILCGEATTVARVRDLGPDRAAERAEFEREGIQSLALVPMSCRGSIIGFLGLDSVRGERVFTDDGLALLRIAGECLANGLERRRFEESLRNNEARLRSIFRASPVGIGLVRERVLLEVNERVCELSGYAREELIGQNARILYPTLEEYEFVGREKYAQIRRSGVGTLETRWRRKDGSLIDILMSSVPLDPEDLSVGVTFTALDITERKRASEALRAAVEGTAGATGDAFFPTLVRCLAQALGVRYAFVGRLSGESPERLESIAAWCDGRIGAPLVQEIGATPFESVLRDQIVLFSDPARPVVMRDPFCTDRKIVFFGGACLRDSHDQPIGVLAVMDEKPHEQASLTESLLRIFSTRAAAELERLRSEEDRRRLEAQVQHVQKLESLGVLAGGIAHDFNNLLMAILGNADLASRTLASDAAGRAYLQDIEAAARRAADLCRQMLAYSGKGRFVVEPVALGEIILEMTRMLEVSISKKATLELRLGENLPAVAADATQIRQIVMNLITNASEALGDQSGLISIATGTMECDREYLNDTYLAEGLPEGAYVWLEVSDSGAGMTPEVRARMFDPFFSTKFTGRGLGMAAVLGIVRGHRGGIRVYSEAGQGTTIRVFFPASRETAVRKVEVKATDGQWRGTGTVLVVDDDDSVCALACRMLALLGFTTVVAGDGRRALDVYRQHRDDITCVLLDLTMPHMDGEEAFHELRRLDPGVRVIMSSGYNELEVTRRFHGEGLAGFIQKPYLFAALRDVMRAALEPPAAGP